MLQIITQCMSTGSALGVQYATPEPLLNSLNDP